MFLWISVHYFNWYLLMGTQIQFPHPSPPPPPRPGFICVSAFKSVSVSLIISTLVALRVQFI